VGIEIELKNITIKEILKDFNLNINPKERLVITGESGSGKTTILRLIAGFIAPDSGQVIIGGEVVSESSRVLVEPHNRGINMVFQDLALWSHMSVEQNIGFGLKVQKKSKREIVDRVDEMLEMVGLVGYNKRAIQTLSGGEQQRVALARALATRPKILLMDEPLSSLDSKRSEELRGEIVRLQEQLGFTLVYVTHSVRDVEVIGSRCFTLNCI